MLCLFVCCVCVVGHLSERRLHVYPGAHILVAQEAGVGGQGIVGKNGVIVRGTGARRVLARRGVLLEGRRQVQVLRRGRERGSAVVRDLVMSLWRQKKQSNLH